MYGRKNYCFNRFKINQKEKQLLSRLKSFDNIFVHANKIYVEHFSPRQYGELSICIISQFGTRAHDFDQVLRHYNLATDYSLCTRSTLIIIF